jgi:molybdenum cofactor cytidylyltransferase
MFFGRVPPQQAQGGVLAHRVDAAGRVFRKGYRLTPEDAAALEAARVPAVTIARLEAGDIAEDDAAGQLGATLAGPKIRVAPAFTGRVNLFAEAHGLLQVDPARIDAFNAIDEGMTLATLTPFRHVRAGDMIATVKIIPFALPAETVEAGLAQLAGPGVVSLHPFQPKRVALLQLALPETKKSVLTKTEAITASRLEKLCSELVFAETLNHAEAPLMERLARLQPAEFDILLIFGAAAIADRRDVIPAAIEAAGGRVSNLGMPVDPGNLLLLGEWQGKPVIGAPGCARSPAENGFDWVLERFVADIPVTRSDIRRMGAGGLLMEIANRPQPRLAGPATS